MDQEPTNAVLLEKINNILNQMAHINEKIDSKADGWVQTLAKGLVGTVLLTVLGGLLALVVISTPTIIAINLINKIS